MVKVNGKTGGGTAKGGKGRQDKYYHLAKETGFRARSAFKLIQLDRKYNFLKDAKVCIDLCAAPGGWMQVAVKHMAKGSLVVGVDLVAIKPVPGAIGIMADITTDKCRQLLKKELKHFKANVVLNDGAPNVGKDWNQDAFTQNGLVLMSLKLACEWLLPGGTFVSKVFRSRDYNSLMYILGKLFKKVRSTKPPSSRGVSAEIFVVCEGYLAPAKIDPKMLDPKFVFGDIDDGPTQKLNIFAPEKKKRQREGYVEGNVGAHAKTDVGTFVASDSYLDILALNNQLIFGEADKKLEDHAATNEEIKILLSDLKLLGKKDFRTLIKWRTKMKDFIVSQLPKHPEDDKEKDSDGMEEDSEKEEEDEQTKLERMVEESKMVEMRERKRIRRKKDKSRAKEQERQALSMDHPMDFEDIITDKQLFSLETIRDTEGLNAVDKGAWEADEDDAGVALSMEDRTVEAKEGNAYLDDVEGQLETEYEEFLERKGMKKKKVVFKGASKIIGASVDPNEDAPDTDYIPDVSDLREESDVEEEEQPSTNPLISQHASTNADKTMNLWFSQKQFADMDDSDATDDDDEEEKEDLKKKPPTKPTKVKTKRSKNAQAKEEGVLLETDSDSSSSSDSDSEDEDGEKDSFEVVKAAARAKKVDNSNNLDAHGLALAAEMIIRKRKREIVDAAYNRYAFNDGEIPSWFVDEETSHRVVGVPVTREMADDIKERQRQINARPIKKVVEAKNRKAKRLGKQLDSLKNKANAIYENDALSEREKNGQIETLYKKARVGEAHKAPTVVVANSKQGNGRPKGVKGRYIMVDGRSKTELRAKKSQALKAKRKKKFR